MDLGLEGYILKSAILDVEAFEQKEFSIDNEELQAEFRKLPDIKNRLFFGSITEETARRFE